MGAASPDMHPITYVNVSRLPSRQHLLSSLCLRCSYRSAESTVVHCRSGGSKGLGAIKTAGAATESGCGAAFPGTHPFYQDPGPTEGQAAGSLAHALLSRVA